MIAIEQLTVQIGGVRALDGLSACLDAPVHGVIGPNGAGKTTLLNVLSGFVRSSAGTLAVDDVSMGRMTPRRRARWGMGRTFQTERVAPQLSASDNVRVAADGIVSRRAGRAAAVQRALAFVELDRPDRPAGRLDGFERKRLELARALVGGPRVVLLDEPAGGLSSAESSHLERLITDIPTAGTTQVVLVDHDVDLIARACSRVLVLDFGARLAEGETDAVLRDEHVRAAWLGAAEVAA